MGKAAREEVLARNQPDKPELVSSAHLKAATAQARLEGYREGLRDGRRAKGRLAEDGERLKAVGPLLRSIAEEDDLERLKRLLPDLLDVLP